MTETEKREELVAAGIDPDSPEGLSWLDYDEGGEPWQ